MITSPRIDEVLATLNAIFLDVPGAVLSVQRASRLTGLDFDTCLALLLALGAGAVSIAIAPGGLFAAGRLGQRRIVTRGEDAAAARPRRQSTCSAGGVRRCREKS